MVLHHGDAVNDVFTPQHPGPGRGWLGPNMLAMYVHVVSFEFATFSGSSVLARTTVAVVIVLNNLEPVAVSSEMAISSARFNLDYLGLCGEK